MRARLPRRVAMVSIVLASLAAVSCALTSRSSAPAGVHRHYDDMHLEQSGNSTHPVLVEEAGMGNTRAVRKAGSVRALVFDAATHLPIYDAAPTPGTPEPGFFPSDSGFTVLHPPGWLWLEAAAPGYAPWRGWTYVRTGRETLRVIRLEPLPVQQADPDVMILTGTVVLANGEGPAAGAIIGVKGSSSPRSTATRADGQYSLVIPRDGRRDGELLPLELRRLALRSLRGTLVFRPGRVVRQDFAMFVQGIR